MLGVGVQLRRLRAAADTDELRARLSALLLLHERTSERTAATVGIEHNLAVYVGHRCSPAVAADVLDTLIPEIRRHYGETSIESLVASGNRAAFAAMAGADAGLSELADVAARISSQYGSDHAEAMRARQNYHRLTSGRGSDYLDPGRYGEVETLE